MHSEIKNFVFPHILKSLKDSAHHLLDEKNPMVVGVTGSAGKSSFLYMLDGVMHDSMKTKTTFHGNSETGLPLEILGIRDLLTNYSLINWLLIYAATPLSYMWGKAHFDYELLIAEMGIDSSQPPKNMGYLLEMIKPDIGVFLSVGTVHSEQFAKELGLGENDTEAVVRAIAHEKGKIVTLLGASSDAIINIDNPYIAELIPDINAKITTFGTSPSADYRLVSSKITEKSSVFEISIDNKPHRLTITNTMLSREYGYTILAVLAAASALGLDPLTAMEKLKDHLALPPGRMSLIEGETGFRILDSSYNASPVAIRGILDTVKNVSIKGEKILVLGDMRELGPLSEKAHKDLGDIVAEIAKTVILVGPLMSKYLAPLLEKRGVKVRTFDVSKGVGEWMLSSGVVKSNDLVVVEGSQNTIFLEQVVFELMKDKSRSNELLCRQSKYWSKTRRNFFESNGAR